MRPSIFSEYAPVSTNLSMRFTVQRSFGLSRYSPGASSSLRTARLCSVYGRRQACAHKPRFAERPPTSDDIRHWPE